MVSSVRAEQPTTERTELIACAHCGLPVPPGFLEPSAPRQYCCAGCSTAWSLIHEHGLEDYYSFVERREGPVAVSGRSFEEFDHDAFRELYVTPRTDGLVETDLYLERVHCASCVWLVEKMPLAIPGVARADLDVGRALAHIVWDATKTPLSQIAGFLDRLGYPPHPYRGGKADELRKREDRASLTRIGVAGAIAANVMMIAIAIYAGWFGGMDPVFHRYFRWWSFLLTTPAVLWPGRVFFVSAWGALRQRALHMDVPIALAIGVGYLRGSWNTMRDAGPIYFDGVATLIFLLLVGRFLQQRAQRAAADSAELLFSLAPSTARVVDGEQIREVPTQAVLPGVTLDVRAGDTLAADGVVLTGRSSMDLSLLSGESRPVAVAEGAEVYAGTINLSAPLRVRVTSAGEQSRLGRILKDVEDSARRRAPVVRLADRMAGGFIAAVIALATLTFLIWVRKDTSSAIDNAIAMLVVTCPCALALATPLAITVAIGRAAQQGILVKGGDALELLAKPSRLILDKTGTLTEGRMQLVQWDGPDDLRAAVLAVEQHSRHPVASAFLRAWGDPTQIASDVRETIGGGLDGVVNARRVVIGKPSFVLERASGSAEQFAPLDDALTPVLVAVDGVVVARAGFGDPLREGTKEALDTLRAAGWRIGILSGDDPRVVAATARALGIPQHECRGGASPEDKRATIEDAARSGTVVMVGDGVNDAAAIAAASVGVGVRGGAEACLAAADVFLTRAGLVPFLELQTGARRTVTLIRLGIGFSLFYNLVGAALALTGVMDPLIAAIVMPVSSLSVVIAAWRGRTFTGATT